MKYICIACVLLLATPHFVAGQTTDTFLDYAIPPNASKVGPINMRDPRRQYYNYFLPGVPMSENSQVGFEIHEAGVLLERTLLKNGRKHGVQREWYPNGVLKSEFPMREGVMQGTFRHWSDTGQLIGQYTMNNGTGVRKVYNTAGEIALEEPVRDGKVQGLRMKRLSKGMIVLSRFEGDELVGRSCQFDENGSIYKVINFSAKGLHHGAWVEYSDTGAVVSTRWFIQGKEVPESEYAAAASREPALHPYFSDASLYKNAAEEEMGEVLRKYRTRPRVKIPLQFTPAGEPAVAE